MHPRAAGGLVAQGGVAIPALVGRTVSHGVLDVLGSGRFVRPGLGVGEKVDAAVAPVVRPGPGDVTWPSGRLVPETELLAGLAHVSRGHARRQVAVAEDFAADLDEDVGAHDHDDDAEPRLPHGGPVGPPTELARTHSTGCPRPLHENIREPRRRGALAVASRDDDAGVVLPASRCRRTSRRRHAATAWLALDARPTDSALAAETAPKFLPSPPTTPPAAALALSASR